MTKLDLLASPRQTAHEMVRDTLRKAILRGTLPGGTRLVQGDIAKQLQVSTTPVREALRDLATEGLIQLDPHRGGIVKQFTYDEIRDIHDVCKLLEPEAMRRAATEHTPEILDRAAELVAVMDHETDVGEWADLNRRFHATLAAGISSPRLIGLLQGLRDSAAPYTALGLQTRSNQMGSANHGHHELMEALRAGDGERAAQVALEHLELTIRTLEVNRDSFPEGPAPVSG